MTDENILVSGEKVQENAPISENINVSSPAVNTQESEGKVSDAIGKDQVKHDRTYTRDELAKIANAESKKSYEKGRQEAIEEYKRTQSQQSIQNTNQSQLQLSDEELAQRIDRIAQQKSIDSAIHNEAKTFVGKLDLENDPEMKLSMQKLKIDQLPMGFIHVLNSVDNSKDVLKEFSKFPEKLTNILSTANFFGIDAGKEAISRISESIKKNQEATNVKLPDAPISQIGPSNTGTDNGLMTAADYRKNYAGRY